MKKRLRINYFRIKIILWVLVIGGFFIWPNPCLGTSNSLLISEVQIDSVDGTGGTNDDFIELYNSTDSDIYLGDYQESYLYLVKRTKTGTSDTSIKSWNGDSEAKVPAHGFYLWANSDYTGIKTTPDATTKTTISTDNGIALRLGLKDTGPIIDSLGWGECQNEFVEGNAAMALLGGQSLERQPTGEDSDNNYVDFVIRDTPTPQNSGGQEILPADGEEVTAKPEAEGRIPPTTANQPPLAEAGPDMTALVNREMFFDASQSYDPDNDSLTYFWNFGDGATDTEKKASHIYLYSGQYIVGLLVDDGEFSDLDIMTVNIYSPSVIISEFMPNPSGEDEENEWIELFNQSGQIANLTNWQLDDQTGDSPPFVFPINSLIAPEQFLIIRRPISQIALDNDRDQVRLLYPDGSLATEISYSGETEEGLAVAFDGQDYFWTKVPTPGATNIISAIGLASRDKNLFTNNPQSFIQETQEPPEILAQTNSNQGQILSPLNQLSRAEISQPIQSAEEIAQQTEKSGWSARQAAALGQSSQPIQKANLILTLSIVISGSLLASWFLIRLKKTKTH
jgi:PKD repeat protein